MDSASEWMSLASAQRVPPTCLSSRAQALADPTTALYLSEGLPPIVPTCVVPGRIHALAQLPPGHNRGALRSRTYLGIAGAMALQWMPVLTEYLLLNPDASDCPATAADLVAQANGQQRGDRGMERRHEGGRYRRGRPTR